MKGLLEAMQILLGRERIEDLPEGPVTRPRTGLFALITAAEELPQDGTPARSGAPSLIPWLFGAEPLPRDEAPPASARRPFLSVLFAREELSRDQEVARPGVKGTTRG